MAARLESEKSFGLLTFHTLIGRDTMSAFVGDGNKTAWAAWNSLPELIVVSAGAGTCTH